jgi:hypothetical protein
VFVHRPVDGGGGLGDGGGGDAVVTGEDEAQMIQPPYVTEPSEYHVKVDPAAIGTLLGPDVPLKRVPPIVM